MDEKKIKQRIEVARKKLELLKSQSTNTQMNICTSLELASQIRDSIINDRDITEYCKTETKYAICRQSLLDEIRKMQLDIITEHTKQYKIIGKLNGNVKDFSNAKQDLQTMIEDEKTLHLFTESEKSKLFNGINECQAHKRTLRNVANDCKNGRYKVLVMGDFQSGKSTTVDALCDGRHVCAIGKGVATSAVLVTVTYADEEYVKINWRSKKQLVGIFAKTKQYLPDYDFSTFDLDNKQNRESLTKAINNLRTSKDCPNMTDGDAKFLMLCDFILYYYGTEELSQKKKAHQTSTNPAEITKFPDKGEILWKKEGVKGFKIDEVLFVFIERVDCFVQSETLRKLNCTVIDSPGLFNSSYDTMITEQAMVEAHAIMYVLPYYKGINTDVCMSLYKIKENYPDVHRKLFVVNNMRPYMTEVFESNCEKIRELFGAGKKVYPYDAKLAYLLQVKGLTDAGKSSEKDYRHLLKVKKKSYVKTVEKTFNTFAEAWADYIADYSGLDSYDSILQGNIEGGLQESGFTDMTGALRRFIENNEAYAIIVSNGLAPMISEISFINKSLYRSYVEPCMSSLEEIKKCWKNRIEKAEGFQKIASKLLDNIIFKSEKSLLSRMAQEEYKKLFNEEFYKDMSYEIAGVIYDNKKALLSIKSMFKKQEYKNKLITKLTPLIQEKVVEIVHRKIEYLNNIIKSKQDETVTNIFEPAIENIELKLLQEWSKLFGDDFNMQDYFNLHKNIVSTQISSNSFTYDTDFLSDDTDKSLLFKGFVTEICTIVAGIVSMIAGYIALVFSDPTGITETVAISIAGVLGIMGGFIAIIAPDWARGKSVKILGDKLLPKIKNEETIKGFKSLVRNQLNLIFVKYVTDQTPDIQKMKNERDLALHPTPDKEKLCFRSVEAMQQLNEQLKIYDKYIQKHITYETT